MASARVGYATRSLYASSGPRVEGVPDNNQRGREQGPCLFLGVLNKLVVVVVDCGLTLHSAIFLF